jgi:hypothetical protein
VCYNRQSDGLEDTLSTAGERERERELLHNWRFTANLSLLRAPWDSRPEFSFSQLNTWGHIPYRTSSLTIGWVCHLQLLLALASAFLLESESRGTLDHILLPQIREYPFCRLLRLAGLRWRYSTPPLHWNTAGVQSQSHIATDVQSISKSWRRALSGTHDLIFITLWQLRSCFCGAPSLSRGRACLLFMLLAVASVVFLGSESLWTHDHVLLSQIWDFLFVASYDSQGHGVRIRPRLHTDRFAELSHVFSLLQIREDSVLVSKSKLCYDRRFSRPVRLGIKHPSGA